jgi:peptidoglycan/xylan/chitin deacetylase (PgdA/CDA1 family)
VFAAHRRQPGNQFVTRRRKLRGRPALSATAVACAAAFACLLSLLTPTGDHGASAARTSSPRTIVSLTFDDGHASQYSARAMLAAHGMHATFYLNSPRIGSDSYYMTWPQINGLYADGNEIAGHSAHHQVLTELDPSEATRQVCYDRNELLRRGFPVTDFAYPFGAYNGSLEAIVKRCGYNSARTTDSLGSACAPCAERLAVKDRYATRVVAFGSNPVRTIESKIVKAERAGGGWAQVVFHEVCNACGPNAISPRGLNSLLDWLRRRSADGTVVKTVRQVVGGPVRAAVSGPALPAPPNGINAIRNASLEKDADGDLTPDCFVTDSWGNQTFRWSRTRDAHTGSFAERVDVTRHLSGDNKLMPVQDLGACATTVTAGRQYKLTTRYKSSVPVHFVVFSRDGNWTWSFWKSGPALAATSSWAQARWTTPPIPRSLNGLSFGLALAQKGSMIIDDVRVAMTGALPETRRCVVPRVVGRALARARQMLVRARCRPGRIARRFSHAARRRVVAQRPRAGARRPAGAGVDMVVAEPSTR